MKPAVLKPKPSLRERKQRLARAEIAEAAVGVLLARGYDDATIDDMAQAAGISRRTFFRYFATKEGVVLFTFDSFGAALLEAVVGQPPGEAPLVALRRAMVSETGPFTRDPARMRRLVLLTLHTPVLRAHFLDKQEHWREQLSLEVARRMRGSASSPMFPRLVAAVAMGAMDAAVSVWAEHEGMDLSRLVDEAFDTLAQVLGSASAEPRAPSQRALRSPRRGPRSR